MMTNHRLVKSIISVIIPSLLFALLTFQIFKCRGKLILRNPYLLESVPLYSDWVWEALSAGENSKLISNSINSERTNYVSKPIPHLEDAHNYHREILLPGVPTLTVHYLWCTEGYFELSHYLSVLSVIHQLQPDKIIVHYRVKPRTDPQGYWRWLEDLEQSVIMLSMRPLTDVYACRHDLSAGVVHDLYDFPDPYGVFLLGDVAVSNLTRADVQDLMIKSFLQRKSFSYNKTVAPVTEDELRKSQVFLVADTEPYHMSQSPGRVVISCPSMATVNLLKEITGVHCINFNSYISHEELLKRNSNVHRFARNIMFGTPDVITANMASTEQIPNVVHIILIDRATEISPLVYVSIKSAYCKGQADAVFVHASVPPTGALWDRLNKIDEIPVTFIPTASSMEFGVKHAALVYALYTLLQHGGIAHFGDVVHLRPFLSSPRHAGAIVTPHYSKYRLKHSSTNTAILAGSKGSVFIESSLARLLQEDKKWQDARADDVITHVREMHPEAVLLDSKLTSHQNCEDMRCQVAGGHGHPNQAYTTRLIWNGEKPGTLDQLLIVQGPTKSDIKENIEISHCLHPKSS